MQMPLSHATSPRMAATIGKALARGRRGGGAGRAGDEVVTVLVRQRNATVLRTADDLIIKAADLDAVDFRDDEHKERTVQSYRSVNSLRRAGPDRAAVR